MYDKRWMMAINNLKFANPVYGISCKTDDDPSHFLLQEQVHPSACLDLAFNLLICQYSHKQEEETEQIHAATLVLLLNVQEKVFPFPSSHGDLEGIETKGKKPPLAGYKMESGF